MRYVYWDITVLNRYYGAARNALLLSLAGEVALQVDDDTVCELRAAPEAEPGLAVSSKGPSAFWHFASRETALDAAPTADADFLALHERLLGRPPSVCAAEAGRPALDVGEVGYATLRHAASPEARVRVTFAGAVGDSATTSLAHLLFLRGPSFERAVRTEAAYRAAKETRHLLRWSPRTSITDGGPCMTMNVGLDGRTPLPPFVPVLRNEDGLFGGVLSGCFKRAFRGHVSGHVLLHDPPEPRRNPTQIAFEPYGPGAVLMQLISAFGQEPHGEAALHALGIRLQDVAGASAADFAEHVRALCLRDASGKAIRLRRRLDEERTAPTYWTADVRHYLATAQEAMAEGRFVSMLDGGEGQAVMQGLIGRFGELLVHWPALWEAAEELRLEGRPLGEAVQVVA